MKAGQALWCRIVPGGLKLAIRLTPKANIDAIEGVETDDAGRCYIKARVRAVPEKGKANKALIALVAKRSGIAKSLIRIDSGETSRLKMLFIGGSNEDLVQKILRITE
ncbi:MAG: DUF167 family protein [Rhizobiaceae bacterium]|nr:DUF167 family protein [Rhizobiaceae bacterium]